MERGNGSGRADEGRRTFLTLTLGTLGAASMGPLMVACRKADDKAQASAAGTTQTTSGATPAQGKDSDKDKDKDKEEGEDVGAVEDLMREHGVIRRVLVVYRMSATRLRAKAVSVPPDALQRAAKLMRAFGEDYHEKKLEEAYIFPEVAKTNAALTSTLTAQHTRGREITEYIIAVTQGPIRPEGVEPLARALESFATMYEEHAAIEDTILFPAWKKALGPKAIDAMGDRFEAIEHETFGKDGFDDAVDKIGAIEKAFGIDLASMIAPPPPKLR